MLTALVLFLGMTQLTMQGGEGAGRGKHIVLLAGDEEYRSEEALPQLARILSQRHGFRCTVLLPTDRAGLVDPEQRSSPSGLAVLRSADLVIMMLRFREWPDEEMKHFVDYTLSGKPILALRTSTHAFDYAPDSASAFRRYSWRSTEWPGGFGRQVLGETWVSHWGEHGKQATLGVPEPSAADHPVLRGVTELFGTTDVYEASPPTDAKVLFRGRVLAGMARGDKAADGRKKTAKGIEQPLNDPMMPIVWLRERVNEAGKTNRILTSTMGSATDLLDEGFRRFLVNGSYWLTGLDPKPNLDVRLVGTYKPSPFGFGSFRRGLKPQDL